MNDILQPVVEANGLARRFGAAVAVESLDIVIRKGEMFGLVGPDGAGKSTAIRLLCGILKPSSGSGRVFGMDLATRAEEIKRRIGYLSQSFTLYGDLSVDENMEFFAGIHEVRDYRRESARLLEFTRLTPFRKRPAGALSGGMKKKLALACTLIHKPDLLLLDEPSTGVDPVSRGEFWNILSDLIEGGTTVLMTTPYLDEAERCHRIGLMHHGRILRTGSPAEVKSALPGAIYRIDCGKPLQAYEALRNSFPHTQLAFRGNQLLFWARGGENEARTATDSLDRKGLGPAALAPVRPSLEDAFVGLITEES